MVGGVPRHDSTDYCTICGIHMSKAKKFYKTVGKWPFCDQLYLCNECYDVLKERSKWIKNREVEEIK